MIVLGPGIPGKQPKTTQNAMACDHQMRPGRVGTWLGDQAGSVASRVCGSRGFRV